MSKKILILALLSPLASWGISKDEACCAFCDESVIGKQIVYRGEKASVLATHKPVVRGHLLVIPNRHVETFDGLTEEEFMEIGKLLKKAHGAKDYFILQKNGILAGQSVPHVHFHLLPRESRLGMIGFVALFLTAIWKKPLSEKEMKAYVSELSQLLGERLE
jgi:diadenosine tetraphosphate (Ap4A) HIT family hydrolase